ncbi:MAG: nucleoside hydrolase [Planctomycetes bacterium]|nr:nucleoside hydrolase [Planctomycetota bacterium]
MKIFLDTDIGTDSDDAVCLAYLLLHTECELMGVTTVGFQADLRAKIAEKVCSHFGHPEIPVVAGAESPVLPNRYWWGHHVNQDVILDGSPERGSGRPADALSLMESVVRDNPDEIALLTVGPTTNAALFATSYPETARTLKAIYTMGGRLGYDPDEPRTECNIMLDPAAACALLSRNLPNHTVFPVNITGPLHLTGEEAETLFEGEIFDPLRQCCGAWNEQKKSDGTGLHDPFTAACLLEPNLCTCQRGRMGIKLANYDLSRGFELEKDRITGWTYFDADPDGPHRVAIDSDKKRFHKHLNKIFSEARNK